MLSRDRLIRMQIHQLVDTFLIAASFWLAYELRASEALSDYFGLAPVKFHFDDYVGLYLLLIPATPLVLEGQGYYSRPMICRRRLTAWILFKACFLLSLGLILALFFVRLNLPRSIVIWFGLIGVVLMMLKEEIIRFVLTTSLARAQLRRRFMLLGTQAETARIRKELQAKSQEEIDVLAELDLDATPLDNLVNLLHEHSVNGVILSGRQYHFDKVEQFIRACELEGVEVWLLAEFFRTQVSRTSFDDFYGRPVLVFRSAPDSSWQGILKQLFDFFSALALLLIGLPFFLLIALIIKRTSPGPVLFKQQRSGLNGRPFTLYKFRTMVSNAEQLKHELAAMNEMTGPVFKVTNDPRITPIGRLLRKFSIDEVPQLYNVLRGEMSMVGPRPLPVDEVKQFNDMAHRRRLSVKPGLTCLWQISGRNNVKDFRDWVRLDLEYIDNWSLWLDFKILWRTVPVVLAGTGAR
jgi:exopolysaccharide biosynthesis polyprenyl glycosylphosphotransferase